jgi:hypothetical protein
MEVAMLSEHEITTMGMSIMARIEDAIEKMSEAYNKDYCADGFNLVVVETDFYGEEVGRREYGPEYEKTFGSLVAEMTQGLFIAVGEFVKAMGSASYVQRYYKGNRISYSVELHASLPIISAWVSYAAGKNPQMVADAVTMAARILDSESKCAVTETADGSRWYVTIGFGRFYSEYIAYDAKIA